ncbi:MAG: hypothetical protein IT371_25155 [Deltaproteobacteria bacterium]|nr:hypothetical protein [Deltaproteobacteria bacterium]
MPSAPLHLTHVELLRRDEAVPARLRRALDAEPSFGRLGAIFPDLPFYTNILTLSLGYWLERPAEPCPLAHRIHQDRPAAFAWHVLERLLRSQHLSRDEALALAAGFFAHVALDLEVHPLVNWCARRDLTARGGHETHHHRLAEKYHSLFFHLDLCGRDCVGVPQFYREKTRILDHPSFLRVQPTLPLVGWIAEVFDFYPEAAPTRGEVAGWLRTFRHFGFLVSLPVAARNSARLGNADNRRHYYENENFRFEEFFRRGYDRSLGLLRLVDRVAEGGDLGEAARAAFLAQAEIGDYAYPVERHLPALPLGRGGARQGDLRVAVG